MPDVVVVYHDVADVVMVYHDVACSGIRNNRAQNSQQNPTVVC